jgi:hypothetical protein
MFLTIATAVAVAATPVADAPDTRVRATYDAASNRYCLRLTSPDATMPSGLGLYRRLCRTQANWARDGVIVERRQLAGH